MTPTELPRGVYTHRSLKYSFPAPSLQILEGEVTDQRIQTTLDSIYARGHNSRRNRRTESRSVRLRACEYVFSGLTSNGRSQLGGLREERRLGTPQISCTAANSRLTQGIHVICCGCFEKNRKQLFQPWKLWGLLRVLRGQRHNLSVTGVLMHF